jgi:NTP pyrophosphatase (non-canonical NTP hydrolase)
VDCRLDEKTNLKSIFDYQKEFDRKLGWNIYENLSTEQDIVDYMQLTVLKFSEEVGEIAQEVRKILRDKEPFNPEAFKQELIDIFVYLIQASIALKMDLTKEYFRKMKINEQRFLK